MQGEECKGGCGKPVNNSTGYCRNCRTKSCKKCGEIYTINNRTYFKDLCVRCAQVRDKSTQRYNDIGERRSI